MGTIVAAMLSSHAYAFIEPDAWDVRRRERSMVMYEQRYGTMPVERAELAMTTLASDERRFKPFRHAYARIRELLVEVNADAVVMIGNDQDEIFGEGCQPQFAIYAGDSFLATNRTTKERVHYYAAPAMAKSLLEATIDANFDTSIVLRFPEDELLSHAHREALLFFDQRAVQRVVPVFVKTIHPPSPSPRRCYEFGKALREAIESDPTIGRVILFSSGGLSHFAPDYPWPEYRGPHTLGAICVDFDQRLVAEMRRGNGAALAELTSADLFENGDLELRQTIVMLGALGNTVPAFLHYEPFYRAIMGLSVGYWSLEK